jgi:hypothetical protein
MSAWLADLVVAVHVAYVSFVVVGLAAILLGAALGWNWVRNPWFRGIHLAAIVIVALEAVAGVDCPLTVWEDALRRSAGQEVVQQSFIGRWLHALIFYDFPPWAFTTAYVSFALVVLLTLFLVPPRWSRALTTPHPRLSPARGEGRTNAATPVDKAPAGSGAANDPRA